MSLLDARDMPARPIEFVVEDSPAPPPRLRGYRQQMRKAKQFAAREAASLNGQVKTHKAVLEWLLVQEYQLELLVRRARGHPAWGLKKAIRRDLVKRHGIGDTKLRAILVRCKSAK